MKSHFGSLSWILFKKKKKEKPSNLTYANRLRDIYFRLLVFPRNVWLGNKHKRYFTWEKDRRDSIFLVTCKHSVSSNNGCNISISVSSLHYIILYYLFIVNSIFLINFLTLICKINNILKLNFRKKMKFRLL